jgi:signal transduction histidine kinase
MSKNILIVNRQTPQTDLFAETLGQAGFAVQVNNNYEYTQEDSYFNGVPPDLVLLCCEGITDAEQAFIARVMVNDCFLVILSPALPLGDARFLLLANPDNLKGASLDPHSLIELVEEAFLSMYGKSAFRESHHLSSGLGLIQFYVDNIRDILKGERIMNSDIERELDKVVTDVRHVLSRSRASKRRDAESQVSGIVQKQETLISATDLLEYSKWALPAPPAHIKLTFDLKADLARVRVVAGQIIEILSNLVENAIEAMMNRSGGEITIAAFNAAHHVHIEVSDTGPGIKPDHQSKIFDMFFSTKENPVAGFGLYDARRFALKNHGDLSLNSQPGHGATFILRLPMVVEGADL